MEATRELAGEQAETLRRRAARRSLRSAQVAAASFDRVVLVGRPPRIDPDRPFVGIEERTEAFRVAIARSHVARVGDVELKARLALEDWTLVASGQCEAQPCKNWKWRVGAKSPAKRDERCSHRRVVGIELHRCALKAGHADAHEIDRSRIPARELLRECSGETSSGEACLRLHGHRGRCKATRPPKWDRACPCALCTLHQSVTSIEWHEGRDRGQRKRFQNVRRCGSRMMTAACGVCGTDRRPVPEGCGVRRVCDKCDKFGAQRRRARFGRARARAFIAGHRYGLARWKRRGGRYTEKMLTLTIPHALLSQASGLVADKARDDLHARVVALFEAWPRLLRKLNRHWQERSVGHVTYHRAFEWTPGCSDEHGHPHFHVYLWSPWVDAAIIAEWWAEALREVGWPVARDREGRSKVRTKLQMLRSFNVRAARELMKGGRRQALTLSRLEFVDPAAGAEFTRGPRAGQIVGPGIDAFKYAEGWTLGDVKDCSDDVRARLYMALEGRRLTQASRSFFLEDAPPECECCGASVFRVRFDPTSPPTSSPAASHCPRGPPEYEYARHPPIGPIHRLARRVLGSALFALRAAAGRRARATGVVARAARSRGRQRLLS